MTSSPSPTGRSTRRFQLSAGEAAVLAVLAVWAVAPLLYQLAISHTDRFDGSDDIFGSTDTLQYLSWIRESGTTWLISNRFDTAASPAVFLHPMFVISGLLWRAGLSVQLTYQLWLPVATLTMFIGFVAFTRRMVQGGWQRLAVLVLALFWVSPLTPLINWAQLGKPVTRAGFLDVSLEMFNAGALWSALPGALVWGLVPLAYLAVVSALTAESTRKRRRYILFGALAGAALAWLHPWQGIVLLMTIAGLAAWDRLDRRNLVLLPMAIATAIPVGYYALLPKLSSAWARAGAPNSDPHFGWWLFTLTPLGLLALLAYRGAGRDPGERILRLWPVMALVLYFLLHSSFIYHALETIALPWSVLAVRGLQSLGAKRTLTWGAVALMTVPGSLYTAQYFAGTTNDRTQYYVTADEAHAMDYLAAAPGAGAVLTPYYLGKDVPFRTGRSTWVGHPTWTPDFVTRLLAADKLFAGSMPAAAAQALVRQSGARYLLSGCSDKNAVGAEVSGMIASRRAFGCATVYELS